MTNQKIETLINKFVAELQLATRAEVMDAIRSAITGAAPVPAGRVPKLKIVEKNPGKRTPEQIDQAKDKVVALLKKKGGLRSEEIQDALSLSGSELSLPISHLMKAKVLKCEGVARGRKYWVR